MCAGMEILMPMFKLGGKGKDGRRKMGVGCVDVCNVDCINHD